MINDIQKSDFKTSSDIHKFINWSPYFNVLSNDKWYECVLLKNGTYTTNYDDFNFLNLPLRKFVIDINKLMRYDNGIINIRRVGSMILINDVIYKKINQIAYLKINNDCHEITSDELVIKLSNKSIEINGFIYNVSYKEFWYWYFTIFDKLILMSDHSVWITVLDLIKIDKE